MTSPFPQQQQQQQPLPPLFQVPVQRIREIPLLLVAEDDPAQQRAYQAVAARFGLQVQLTASTSEIFRLAHQLRPDAILLDLNIEDGNTLKVLGCLRESPETASTPVAVISAYLVPETLSYIESFEGVRYLPKPWQIEELLALVEQMIGWRAKGPAGVSAR